MKARPPWQGTTKSAHDIEAASKAYYKGFNPNDPVLEDCLLMHHNDKGQLRTWARTQVSANETLGLAATERRSKTRISQVSNIKLPAAFTARYQSKCRYYPGIWI